MTKETQTVMVIAILLMYAISTCINIYTMIRRSRKGKKSSKNPCDCNDVNHCSKICDPKKRFFKDFQDGKV